MKAYCLLVLGLLAQGCLGNAFYVDSRFTPAEETQIRAAADSWEAVGAEPIDFIWRQHVDITDTGRRVIVRASERLARIASESFEREATIGVNQNGFGFERIILDVDRFNPDELQIIVAHEMGHHYIGDGHLDDKTALMFRAPKVTTPTPADVRALARSRQP